MATPWAGKSPKINPDPVVGVASYRGGMKRGRWLAVVVCTIVVGASIALLSLVLNRTIDRGSPLRFAAVAAVVLLAVAPFLAAWLSGRTLPFVGGAGGLAIGIGATVAAAAIEQGGTGAFALTLGIAVAGALSLKGSGRSVWGRLPALALLAVYAYYSGRLVSAAFAYPLLGVADELIDAFTKDEPPKPDAFERVTTSRR
jgi:hypothetical protein